MGSVFGTESELLEPGGKWNALIGAISTWANGAELDLRLAASVQLEVFVSEAQLLGHAGQRFPAPGQPAGDIHEGNQELLREERRVIRGEARRQIAEHPRLRDSLVSRALMLPKFSHVLNELIDNHH